MKTAFFRSRYLLLGGSLLLASLYSLYRVGPGPSSGYLEIEEGSGIRDAAIRENLRRYLKARYGYRIDEGGVVLAPRFGVPEGYGYSVIGWFCAIGPEQDGIDLYSVNAFMSAAGIPLSVERPMNVSKTRDAEERILDAMRDRVLYTVESDVSNPVIIMLGFDEEGILKGHQNSLSFAHRLDAYQRFGRGTLPWRVELVTQRKHPEIIARLFDDRIEGSIDGVSFTYELRSGRVTPMGLVDVVQGETGEHSAWNTWLDVLYSSTILGQGRLTTLLDMSDSISRRLSNVVSEESHTPLFPPQLPKGLAVDELNWPPTLAFGSTSDIYWKNSSLCETDDCPVKVLAATVKDRLDGVTVMALDSRRLGLQYRPGRKYPRATTGLVGAPDLGAQISSKVLMQLPIADRTSHGHTGVIAQNRTLVPAQNGQPTILMNNRGKTAFGLWSGGVLGDEWSSLWQRAQPIIEGGFIVHAATQVDDNRGYRHPNSAVFRSAIGLSADGHILYAYGNELTTAKLANALIQAGAVFAMPILDHDPKKPFLRTGRVWDKGLVERLEMPVDQPSAALPYFLIYETQRLPIQTVKRADNWSANSGRFRVFYQSSGYKLMSKLQLSGAELKTPSGVSVYAMDSLQLRAHLLPGWAEPRPGDSERLDSLRLPSQPLLSLNIGLRNQRSPFGMIFERRVWRQPKRGALSLVADGRGTMRFGTYGSKAVPDTVRWFTLIQGPTLMVDGKTIGQGLSNRSNVPVVAVGLHRDVAYFILSDDGNREAVTRAADLLGLRDLMLLGERGTAHTGLIKRYFAKNGTLFSTTNQDGHLKPFEAGRAFDTALLFTGRVAQPQATSFSGQLNP